MGTVCLLYTSNFDLTATLFTTLFTFEQSIEEKQLEVKGLELSLIHI